MDVVGDEKISHADDAGLTLRVSIHVSIVGVVGVALKLALIAATAAHEKSYGRGHLWVGCGDEGGRVMLTLKRYTFTSVLSI